MNKVDDLYEVEIDKLRNKYKKAEAEYLDCLGLDMKEKAYSKKSRMKQIEKQIEKLEEERDFGNAKEMSQKIKAYKSFICTKGLEYEFENYFRKMVKDE